MSSYGKLDESEQARLEAHRKTRKRIAVISLSAIVLAGIVVAAVLGTITSTHNNKDNNNINNNPLSSSVKALCDITLYKEACYSSLGPIMSDNNVKPEELFMLSLKVALNEVSMAANKYFSDNNNGVLKGLISDNRTKEAYENCKELMGLALDHLNESLSSAANSSLLDVVDDLQTWLSASGTYLIYI